MPASDVVMFGACIIAFALISQVSKSWPLTMPMTFVGLGALMSATGVLELDAELSAVGVIAELALAVILFSDAVRIDLRALRRNALLPTRLLLIGLPLTIVLGTVVNGAIFPTLPLVEVALLAAILSPTDAALGAAVVEDEVVPLRERLSLNVESGLNDGLVVPVVSILTVIALTGDSSGSEVFRTVVEELGYGLLVGLVAGGAGIICLAVAHDRGWSDGRYEQIATFAIPIVSFFGADALHGSGFIAAFVSGLVFGGIGGSEFTNARLSALLRDPHGRRPDAERFAEFTEDAAQLLGISAFFVFGNVFVGEALGTFDIRVWSCALFALTVMRMLPVWLAYTGTDRPWQTRIFVGWFGPRGLASIVFGILLVEDAADFGEDFGDILGVINVTVTASVLLHGVSAAWGARRYGAWAAHADMDNDERADMFMDDMDEEMAPRVRWGGSSG